MTAPPSFHFAVPRSLSVGARGGRFALLLLLVAAGSVARGALDPANTPGQNFDLSRWKLQLPINTYHPDNNGLLDPTGLLSMHVGVDEVYNPALVSYTSAYFYTNSDGAMRFYAPTTGDTTSGSNNPRSELREIYSDTQDSWTDTGGTAILDGTLKVYQTPAATGKVCIGQIHGDVSVFDNPLPLLMMYQNGQVWAEINYSPAVDNRFKILTTNVGSSLPSSLITYRIVMVPGAMIITLNGVTQVAVIDQSDATGWQNSTVYFKAGDYVQIGGSATGVPAGDGGSTAFYSLKITHLTGNLNVTTTTLPAGLAAVNYSQTLQAASGSGALTWSLPSAVIGQTDGTSTPGGSLPAGLTLGSNGVISGVPTLSTANKTYSNIVVQVTDATGAIAIQPVSLAIGLIGQSITFAGPADQAFSPSAVTLAATADSGLPVTFTVVSGPASIKGNTLTFTGAGSVTVRADQAGNSSYAAASGVARTFSVFADYASWQLSRFSSGELANLAVSGPAAVYGADGWPNLVKYALGLEPKQNVTAGLPTVSRTATDWVYTYSRPSALADVTYAVEVSADLSQWTATGVTQTLVSSAGGIDTWQATYPLASTLTAFFRLAVSQN